MSPGSALSVWPIPGIGTITPGDDLAEHLARPLRHPARPWTPLQDADVIVITQKIVSKAEGRVVSLDPDDPAAKQHLVDAEARRVLRRRGGLRITETEHGFVCANSGVDLSNVAPGTATLLPTDPDRSARRLRDGLRRLLGLHLAVIVSDTFGRPWRQGLTDVAIGCAGIAAVVDLRGTPDATGRELAVTQVCVADELASAAELVMGKDKGVPAAVVRGVPRSWLRSSSIAREVVRPPAEDLFR